MLERPNNCGGATLILAEGDDLDNLPDSHRDIVTVEVRNLAAKGWTLSLFLLIPKQTVRLI